jgi:hypothetical protein
MEQTLDGAALEGVYHHIFLPPHLPQASDDATNIDRDLINLTVEALSLLEQLLPGDSAAAIGNALTAIKNLKAVNSLELGGTSEFELHQVLTGLRDGQSTSMLIRQQNAAVMVTRQQSKLVFETFELSPSNSSVISAKGRLARCFPGPVVALDTQSHPGMLQLIAQTLSSMSHGAVYGMQPTIVKAGAKHNELRDTTNPSAVTELFVGFLRGFGESASVNSISKNTRDEVLWSSALAPWRRSPMWLLIKVTLQLLFSRSSKESEQMYKKVMLFIHSHVTDLARMSGFPSDRLYAMSAKIVRRLHKLRASGVSTAYQSDELLAHADGVLERASVVISGRWREVVKRDSRSLDLDMLKNLDTTGDTHVLLPALDDYIVSMKNRPKMSISKLFAPSAPMVQYDSSILPSLLEKECKDFHRTTANLQQLERWVSQNLDPWLPTGDVQVLNACPKLYDIMLQYHQLASKHYSSNPEGLSVMILIIFELLGRLRQSGSAQMSAVGRVCA